MGRKSRAKIERREQVAYLQRLTTSAGTWLGTPPAQEERDAVARAHWNLLLHHMQEYRDLIADIEQAHRMSLELLRDERFAPLHFSDEIIEQVLERVGEPPLVEDPDDPAFAEYVRSAVASVATSLVRRVMGDQLRRFLPQYIEAGQLREAIIIDYNAKLTQTADVVSPFLVQMLVAGLARWYNEHEEEEEDLVE